MPRAKTPDQMELGQNCHGRPSSGEWEARCCAPGMTRILHDLFFLSFLRSAARCDSEHIIAAAVDPIRRRRGERFG